MSIAGLSSVPTLLTTGWMLLLLGAVLVALVVFYWWVYRVEGRRLTGRQRRLLWALRIAVGAVVILMLSRPALNVARIRTERPVAAILLDESTSMAFPGERENDLYRGARRNERTRYDGAKRALDLLQQPLSQTHRVKVFIVSDTFRLIRDVPLRESPDRPPETLERILERAPKPTGVYSNLGEAILDVVRDLKRKRYRVSAVALLSDGRVTGGTTLDEAADSIAREREDETTVPVHAITFGADHPLRDLRIDEVAAPPEASLGDLLTFRLKITNYVQHNLSVDLSVTENGKEIRRPRKVEWRRMGQQEVVVHTVPEVEGEREFRFTLPVFEDEINTDNNEATVTVKVVKRGLRVLMIAGRPTLEYHYLVPALLRDPIVKLTCYLQSADVNYIQQGNAGIDRLPRTTRGWATFDVVVLIDADPKGLSSQQVSGLEALVRKGGGLVVIAGRCFGLDMLLQVHPTKLSEMLPVQIDKNRHPDYSQLFQRGFRGARTQAGAAHPVMIASPDASVNERIWSTFPDFYWHHPTVELRRGAVALLEEEPVGPERLGAEEPPAPAAADLLEGDGRGRVLMAVRRYGEGAVFYSGLNSLWRWRYPCESYDYDRLWTRVVRYLGETRLLGAQKQVALTTDKAVYAPGEDIIIILRILDPALMLQLKDERVFATVAGAGGGQLPVELTPDAAGLPEYRGLYIARHLGQGLIHTRHVSAKADSEQKPLFDVKHRFEVKMRSLEELDTSADLEGMRTLAEATGGVYLDYQTLTPQALARLAEAIPTEPQITRRPVVVEMWDVWNGVAVLLLFLVLVSVEWSLRKLWGVL